MKLSFKQHLLTSLLCTGLFSLVVACGGGSNSILNPIIGPGGALANAQQLVFKAVPGAASLVASSKGTIAMAVFQTSSASATPQSFSGLCHQTPTGSNTSLFVYGLGKYDNANCSTNIANFLNPLDGAPVVDDGTLTNLIVTTRVAGVASDSGKVEIFVNGQVTTMGCTIGTATRCRDKSSVITVHDGDHIGARLTVNSGDNLQDVQIAFAKQ